MTLDDATAWLINHYTKEVNAGMTVLKEIEQMLQELADNPDEYDISKLANEVYHLSRQDNGGYSPEPSVAHRNNILGGD